MSEAGDEKLIDAEPARPTEGPSRAERARRAGYRKRFGVVYVILALVAGAAIGALVVLVSRPDAAPAPEWSAWQPSGSRDAQVKQIADRVAKKYRLQSGGQLAVALASPPKVSGAEGDIPVSAIAIRPDTSRGQAEENDIDFVQDAGNKSVQYVLCGLGNNCSIAEGEPSEARHALLRREALELSLYTLKYVDDVDSVTVFLPPRPMSTTDTEQPVPTTVFLKRSDVKDELGKPLDKTIAPSAPGIGGISRSELSSVNRITRAKLYAPEYTQAQDGSAILVLSPLLNT